MKFLWLLAAVWALTPLPPAFADEDADDEALAIAEQHGMDHLDRLDALRFTFNVRFGTTTVSRSWTWDAARNRATVKTKVDGRRFEHAFSPGSLRAGDRAKNEKADRWFINDTYWLLFPHHIANDRGMELSLDEDVPLPIPPGRADRLTVAYGDHVGYTPGDVYEVFYDEDYLIRQWVFRKGGASAPTMVSTWEDYARAGPLLVALRHRNPSKGFELWFTDVEAKARGSAAWEKAEPVKQ